MGLISLLDNNSFSLSLLVPEGVVWSLQSAELSGGLYILSGVSGVKRKAGVA